MDEIVKTHLSAAVPLAIERIRARGGTTETDQQWAQQRMNTIREEGGGHAVAFLDPGHTQKEMSLLTEILAILAFEAGGVRFMGLHFEAERTTFGIMPDAAFFASIEPFRVAMEQEEQRGSNHPDEVSAEEMARLHALSAQVCSAVDAGNMALVARLEDEMDRILMQPQPARPAIDATKLVQTSLFDAMEVA